MAAVGGELVQFRHLSSGAEARATSTVAGNVDPAALKNAPAATRDRVY